MRRECRDISEMINLQIVFSLCIIAITVDFVRSLEITNIDVEGPKGRATLNEFGLFIVCYEYVTMSEAIGPDATREFQKIHVKQISIDSCIPPVTSYANEFQSMGINVTNIESMSITFNEKRPIPPGNYTVGLNLTDLTLIMKHTNNNIEDIFRNAPDFLDPLTNLRSLSLYSVRLPRIPTTMRLNSLVFSENSSIDDWGNCQYLEMLEFSEFTSDVPLWPTNCTALKDLSVHNSDLKLHRVLASMIPAAPSLNSLALSSNLMTSLPAHLLESAQTLVMLDLHDNDLRDQAFEYFLFLPALESLDLSKNPLRGQFLSSSVLSMLALRHIYINDISLFNEFCKPWTVKSGIKRLELSPVETVTFKGTKLFVEYCFLNSHFKNLTFMELTSTLTEQFKLMELPTTGAKQLTINFSKPFEDIYFSETDYTELEKRNASLNNGTHHNSLTVLATYVDCNCKHGWLARALRDFPNLISMPDLRCNNSEGISILEQTADRIECKLEPDDEYDCVFRKVWGADKLDAECKTGVLPWKDNIRSLNVSGSGLTSFYPDVPQNVQVSINNSMKQWVDYRNNKLSTANQTVVDTMFLNRRRVWLDNNEIICDCSNRILLDAILEHSEQVNDFDNLTCIGTGQLIKSVSTAELCQTKLKISMGALGFLAGLTLVIAITLRRYREEIGVFLYSRGCRLACIWKKELDDKPYDAFVSFAHGDDNFVKDVLVPRLEGAPEKFRLCVHDRDWVVGGWIPAQIMRSVTHSKRTIIVLSKNFVASTWSALEFRYALANAAADDISRVLVLVLDDVLERDLNPELQDYLAFNTYLRCDDPWFWQKLRYAMPHRTKNTKTPNQTEESVNMKSIG